jgi:hypothetical protein
MPAGFQNKWNIRPYIKPFVAELANKGSDWLKEEEAAAQKRVKIKTPYTDESKANRMAFVLKNTFFI